ncbi:retrovirus-related pol polyprotein from transposon TNT 1-94 [Tanacetum coccineum]
MDLCGPMRVESITGKKYVLVIVDDYSRYTWTYFLRSKDETPEVLINFLRLIQRGLHAQKELNTKHPLLVHLNRTALLKDGTVLLLRLLELSAAKIPLFFCPKAIATICFTQNHSLVIPRYEKTPYNIIIGRKPTVKFFHIFGSLCYIFKDGENLNKMKEKGDACISVVYSTQSKDETVTTSLNELDMLFSPMFDEYFNEATSVLSNSSAISTAVAFDKPPPITATENIDQAEDVIVDEDEFINIFSTPVHEVGESSSRHVDPLNMYTFNQIHPFEHYWIRDHPLKQVIGNPSQPVRTRRQLETDDEMCMFSLTFTLLELLEDVSKHSVKS